MAPRTSKQADRKNDKKAAKQESDEHPSSVTSNGDLVGRVKALFIGSCMVETVPLLQDLLQEKEIAKPTEKKDEKEEGTEEKTENDENKENAETKETIDKEEKASATKIFESLGARLTWCNVLGLAEPVSGGAAKEAFLALKDLELDFGPKAKKRGSPGMERIMVNMNNNLPQYLHILLALMMLRAFLFRSFFACLPWLVGYQVLSLLVPLTNLPQVPQVPLEQIPTKFRVVGTIAIHALVWFFFLFEVVWKTYFFEKIPIMGLFAYHAYAVRPVGQ
jgi:hypothetical protein